MKVLLLSASDISGGASIAAYRLHRALLSNNIDSQMLVQNKSSDDFTVLSPGTKIKKILYKLRPKLDSIPIRFYKNKTKTLFSPALLGFSPIVDQINAINPDIVHLHWISGGMMSVDDISKINVPIVWSLHDMWAFTGGCHYNEHCNGYEKTCGNCKVLNSNKKHDLSERVFKKKIKAYSKIKNLVVVGLSKWISRCASKSTLFENREIVTLPNCLDVDLFKNRDKKMARGMFHIPKNKKVILFGAMNSLGDPRKGAAELFKAIDMLEVKNAVFVIAGSGRAEKPLCLKYPVYFIPPLQDEVSMSLLYNVADVFIVPSLQENLSNSIVESLSCGVPVVAFNIGGNKDMIDHKKNGYLADIYNTKDMAQGIEWILKNKKYKQLTLNARDKILNKFDSKYVAQQYADLYKSILGN